MKKRHSEKSYAELVKEADDAWEDYDKSYQEFMALSTVFQEVLIALLIVMVAAPIVIFALSFVYP